MDPELRQPSLSLQFSRSVKPFLFNSMSIRDFPLVTQNGTYFPLFGIVPFLDRRTRFEEPTADSSSEIDSAIARFFPLLSFTGSLILREVVDGGKVARFVLTAALISQQVPELQSYVTGNCKIAYLLLTRMGAET